MLFQNLTLYFQSSCGSQWEVQRFPTPPLPLHVHSLFHCECPHQSDTFAIIDEPALAHIYPSESIVYIKVHSWWCTLYGFGQPSVQYQTEQVQCIGYCFKQPSLWYFVVHDMVIGTDLRKALSLIHSLAQGYHQDWRLFPPLFSALHDVCFILGLIKKTVVAISGIASNTKITQIKKRGDFFLASCI